MDDFKAANLTDSQLESIVAMERNLQASTGNKIVIVAYEHISNDELKEDELSGKQ